MTSGEKKKRPGKILLPRKGVGSAKEKWHYDENVETVGDDETHSSRTLGGVSCFIPVLDLNHFVLLLQDVQRIQLLSQVAVGRFEAEVFV